MTLGRTTLRGGAVTLAGQWGRYALQIVSLVVLSRLLDPQTFGVMAMVTAVVNLGEIIRDAGLSNGAIQRDELSREEQSTLFWINGVVGLAVGAIVIALAQPLASFYDEPLVEPVAMAMACVPILGGFTAQFIVDLSRDLRFTPMAGAEAASTALGVACAIGAALAGAGVWSLVALQGVTAASRLVILSRASSFRPGKRVPVRQVTPILRYGLNLLLSQALDFVSKNADNVILGRVAGPAALGLYSRAYQLLTLPLMQINAPLTRVALPVLSRLRSDPKRFVHYLETAATLMAYAGCLFLTGVLILAPEVVRVGLGEQWSGSVPLFRALAIAGVLQVMSYIGYWLYLSLDRTDVGLKYSLIAKPFTVVGFVVGAQWGAIGVAWSYSITSLVTVPLAITMACAGTFVSVWSLMALVGRPALLAAFVGAGGLVLRGTLEAPQPVGFALVGAAVVLAVTPFYIRDYARLREVGRLVRSG